MKVLPTARILIVDSDPARREITTVGLKALGVGAVTEVSSIEEALAAPRAFDVIVVQAASVDLVPDHPFRDGPDAIPGILVTEGPSTVLARLASRAGYDAAIAMPLLPRLLYRRIGSVLQKARRAQRPALASHEDGAVRSPLLAAS
ncbi:hypothetical protein V5F77_02810 [Xanthobacter sp. DSM 24535]|uniref:hypothetical protein n=1 Tax=Roseixanthobacter psychrophilus TaxID=3119917 RepID=UPI00372766B4